MKSRVLVGEEGHWEDGRIGLRRGDSGSDHFLVEEKLKVGMRRVRTS